MKAFLIAFSLCFLAGPGQGQILTLQQRALEKQVASYPGAKALSDLPILSRGLISEDNSTTLSLAKAGQALLMQDLNWTYSTTLAVTKPTAARTVTIQDASGTLALSGISSSAAYNPSGAATVTLTAAQSGQTFQFDTASGNLYTLPAPSVGLTYNFQVTTSVTSNFHEVKTNAGTVFLQGTVAQVGSTTTFGFLANGTTHQALKMNGSTTGGLIGAQFTLTCVSATGWMISGINVASGTAATPFTATP